MHGPVNVSDECKVLNDFGYMYDKDRPFKERGYQPIFKRKFGKNQQVNSIVQHTVDETVLQENEK